MKQESNLLRNNTMKQAMPGSVVLMIVFMGLAFFSLVLLNN